MCSVCVCPHACVVCVRVLNCGCSRLCKDIALHGSQPHKTSIQGSFMMVRKHCLTKTAFNQARGGGGGWCQRGARGGGGGLALTRRTGGGGLAPTRCTGGGVGARGGGGCERGARGGGGVGDALTRCTAGGGGAHETRSPHTSPCIHKVVHIQACAYTRRCTQKAVCSHRRSLVIEGATGKAVHTQGGAHKRRSVATARVLLFKGP